MDKPCRMLQLSILKACRGEGGGGGGGVGGRTGKHDCTAILKSTSPNLTISCHDDIIKGFGDFTASKKQPYCSTYVYISQCVNSV